jgi:hypothetical protein
LKKSDNFAGSASAASPPLICRALLQHSLEHGVHAVHLCSSSSSNSNAILLALHTS